MLKPELYKKTVDILYNAYFNDTLRHRSCYACAVGNIVAANCGYDVYHFNWINGDGKSILPMWDEVHCLTEFHIDEFIGTAKAQILATGYTPYETHKIELAFENAPKGETKEDWMFNGLQNVLEVLKEIHQADEPTHDAAVQPFATHYATKQPA